MQGITLDVAVHGIDDLDSVGWPGVADAHAWDMHVFQCREFLAIWAETIGARRKAVPKLVVVSRGGQPAMFLPLCVETHVGTRVLRFMDGGVADFNAPILARGAAPRAEEMPGLVARIARMIGRVDAIDLSHMPVNIEANANPLAALPTRPSPNRGSAIVFDQPAEVWASDPERKPVLGQMARKRAQGEKRQGLAVDFAPPPGDIPAIVDFLFDHKSKQYIATTGVDALAFPGLKDFFRAVSVEGLASGLAHVSVLRLDGEIAAAHLGYRTSRRLSYILMADDRPRFSKMSCGTLLLLDNVAHWRAAGLDAVDLGIGAEPWKRVWRTSETLLVDHLSAVTARGRVYTLLRRAIAEGTMLGELRRRWRARGARQAATSG
jgi:CelD/BcsL family acetyltransferase involved in cellulose biosynthesis